MQEIAGQCCGGQKFNNGKISYLDLFFAHFFPQIPTLIFFHQKNYMYICGNFRWFFTPNPPKSMSIKHLHHYLRAWTLTTPTTTTIEPHITLK